MHNNARLTKLFFDLVRVNSISRDENACSHLLKKDLSQYGFSFVEDNAAKIIEGNCGNLYATLKSNSKKKLPVIMLNAHIDTVVHEGSVSPVLSKGVIKSEGDTILAADCKAGVAALIEAVLTVKEKKIEHGEILVCFTVAEEIGLIGAKHCDKKLLKADLGFVIDGGSPENIIVKAPAQFSFDVEITGRAAHAGVRPEDGISAIQVASQAISKMKLGRIDSVTTANIGIITAGTASNIIPEKALIKGEARSHDPKKLDAQIEHMEKMVKDACKKNRARFKINISRTYSMFSLAKNSQIVKLAQTAAKNAGLRPKLTATGGGSDANIFNKMGMPSIILGVGAHNPHTSQEYISAKDLNAGTELIIEIIKAAAKT